MEKQSPHKQPDPVGPGDAGGLEEEINLADYFRVLWKRKLVIIFGSILPALIVITVLLLRPAKFKLTHVFDLRDTDVYEVGQRERTGPPCSGPGWLSVLNAKLAYWSN